MPNAVVLHVSRATVDVGVSVAWGVVLALLPLGLAVLLVASRMWSNSKVAGVPSAAPEDSQLAQAPTDAQPPLHGEKGLKKKPAGRFERNTDRRKGKHQRLDQEALDLDGAVDDDGVHYTSIRTELREVASSETIRVDEQAKGVHDAADYRSGRHAVADPGFPRWTLGCTSNVI